MFCKRFSVDPGHVDFQNVVDGLYYPFYMEWTRHAYMAEVVGLDLEEEFRQGRIHMLLEYSLRFKKSLRAGDELVVTCEPVKNEKRGRVNFFQQILVSDVVYAEATFTATCLTNGRPVIPPGFAAILEKSPAPTLC